MPPTDAHGNAGQAEPTEEMLTSTTTSQKDRDAKDISRTEPGPSPISSRRSSDTSTQAENDEADGPLNLGPNNQHELPVQNEFGSRKVVAHAMMDAALFMANISQLRMLLAARAANKEFFTPILYLIITSITCQVVFAILILIIWARDKETSGAVPDIDLMERSNKPKDVTTQRVHVVSVVMVYVILVTNMFITGLGIEPVDNAAWPSSDLKV